jgi:hypothetical protein
MEKKQVKFDIENLARLGDKGTCKDDRDSALKKLLDLDDDVNRCLEGEEPQTEKMQKLKRKWCK